MAHSTAADLIPQQIRRENGGPMAAVPLSWSHAILAIAVATTNGRQVWKVGDRSHLLEASEETP